MMAEKITGAKKLDKRQAQIGLRCSVLVICRKGILLNIIYSVEISEELWLNSKTITENNI